jgi:pimeloyl-ACP methyl ester carboxylesterase
MFYSLAKTDFFIWAMKTYSRPTMVSMIGVPKELQSNLSEDNELKISEILKTVLPVKPRSSGILFDSFVSNPDMDNYPFEKISVPTLVIHAKDDPLSAFDKVLIMAHRIPGTKLIGFETGGHMLLGHKEVTKEEIEKFITQWST